MFIDARKGGCSPGLVDLQEGFIQVSRTASVSIRKRFGFLCAGNITKELQLGFKPALKICKIHQPQFHELQRKPRGVCSLLALVSHLPSSSAEHGLDPKKPLMCFPPLRAQPRLSSPRVEASSGSAKHRKPSGVPRATRSRSLRSREPAASAAEGIRDVLGAAVLLL